MSFNCQDEMYRNFNIIPLICLVFIFLGGCDKYISYDYSAGSIGSLVGISGRVTNIFTGVPVRGAILDFGSQRTYSDTTGKYHIEYVLGVDEQRDKPVPLAIRADNYMPFEQSFILYPVDTVINLRLEYGAPIVEQIWVGYYSDLIIFQARIHDYQSLENISRVYSEMHYFKNGESDSRALAQEMSLIAREGNDAAIYQSVGPPSLGDGWFFELRKFLIGAEDQDGFVDEVRQRNNNNWAADTLFTPIPLL